MSEFRFQLTTFLLVALLAFGGYWAFATLDRGITYTKDEQVAVLPDETTPEPIEEPVVVTETPDETTPEPEPEPAASELSEDELALRTGLENLIKDDIYMKEGSYGTRVGTVQKFLNWYFEDSSAVDNSYGPGTKERVRKFQQAEGLGADGLAGPATYEKMIELLEQG